MLNPDFREFIQLLNDNGVRYLVISGYAVALHGYPRYTKDMDIWVDMTAENAAKIVKALEQCGLRILRKKATERTVVLLLMASVLAFVWAFESGSAWGCGLAPL